MHALVEAAKPAIEALCRRFGVRRLDVFGSALGDAFDPASSDLDVLVEFDLRAGFDYVGSYFDLKEGSSGSWGVRSNSSA